MAQANESLVIDVTVNDKASVQIDAAKTTINNFGQQAQKSFANVGTSAEKMGGIVGTVTRKFEALGKAAIGIFAADIAAKVFGFTSALDLVRKASDEVALSIRTMLGMAGANEVDKAKENIDRLRASIDQLREAAGANRFDLNLGGNAGTVGIRIPSVESVQGQLEIKERIAQAQARLDRFGQGGEGLGVSGAPQRSRGDLARELQQDIDRLAAAYNRLDSVAKEAAKAATERAKELYGPPELPDYAGGAVPATFEATGGRWVLVDGEYRFFGFGPGYGESIGPEALPDYTGGELPTVIEGRKDGKWLLVNGSYVWFSFGSGYGEQIGPQEVPEYAGNALPETQLTRGAQAFENLKQSVGSFSDALKEQGTYQAFDSFRGFFNDLISGSQTGAEAFKSFARSIVAGLGDILAQQLAMRSLSFLGFGGVGFANGGVVRGGINSFAGGGIATGPQLAMIGDNRSQTEAVVPMPDGRTIPVSMQGGAGGKTVNMTLNVASLDPSTAASVILAQMPAIQRALTDALSGSDRNLIVAVRGAAS